MTPTPTEFMVDWVAAHIGDTGASRIGQTEADAGILASTCILDGGTAGIPREALEAAFGDLADYMRQQVQAEARLSGRYGPKADQATRRS